MSNLVAKLYFKALSIRDREEGQAMAEYGILLALIAVVVIATVAILGKQILAAFETVVKALPKV